ncbi:periplasmic binding domain/transglycosylase SLT domain fusion protein [Pseudomonas syringae pv. tomato T1]|nr:periplasmic binding domain/transglycosylase SLT domain fusion protein [Pseudomonas syringae pv. tomato T1]
MCFEAAYSSLNRDVDHPKRRHPVRPNVAPLKKTRKSR